MKTTAILLPCLALSGCSHSSPQLALPPPAPIIDSTPSVSPRADSPRIYRLISGSIVVNSGYGVDLDALNHITILGAVKYPGGYYFEGSALLEEIVNSAQPFPNNEGSAHTCGSADLTKIQILSASRDGTNISGPLLVNFLRYSAPSAEGTIKKRISLTSGVIHIHEWF